MITPLNYFSGTFIKFLSLLIVKFNPSLKKQFRVIKNEIISIDKNRKQVPESLLNSIIKIEDKRFHEHLGVDFYSIVRAITKNVMTNRLEGASTIVQQLVRNITNEREIKLRRKVREIILASLVDIEFTKEEILSAYISSYKFDKCIGVFEFCESEKYNINNLSLNDTAQIATRFKYPAIHSRNYVKYLKRVRTIERKTTHNIRLKEIKKRSALFISQKVEILINRVA